MEVLIIIIINTVIHFKTNIINNRIKPNQQNKHVPLIIKVDFYENIVAHLFKKNHDLFIKLK